MWKKLLGSILRHGASIAGGALIATSGTSADGAAKEQALLGAGMALISAIVSMVKAVKQSKQQDQLGVPIK
jgi:hypothetical protein